ncbi:MAG: hypothetical protein V3U49_05675 [Nitrososphaerales archaeon]
MLPNQVAERVRSILDAEGPLRYTKLVKYYNKEFDCSDRKAKYHLTLLKRALQKGEDYDLRGIQREFDKQQTWFRISAGQVVQEKYDAFLKDVEDLVGDMTDEALSSEEKLERLNRELDFERFEAERMREKIQGLMQAGVETELELTRLELGLVRRQLEDLQVMARILAERPSSK